MPVTTIEIRNAVDADALRAAWPVVQQLRPEFDCERYVAQVLRQVEGDGCRATVLYDDGVPRAFACWRVMEMLAVGRHVYIDDLVTDASVRSRGHGKALLDWLKDEAPARLRAAAAGLRPRKDAHAFYLREGLRIGSFHRSLD
jgi:GNAT superfamily N-acetyltransferase